METKSPRRASLGRTSSGLATELKCEGAGIDTCFAGVQVGGPAVQIASTWNCENLAFRRAGSSSGPCAPLIRRVLADGGEASQDANNLQEDSFDQHGERCWTGFWLGNK